MADTLHAGHPARHVPHERRDVDAPLLGVLALVFVILGALLHVLLWDIHRAILPDATGGPVSFPVRTPGEATVNARIESVTPPRLDPLEPLRAEPPSYRSSRPIAGRASLELHPEDLRADRQAILKTYGWVDRERGIVRIPIDRAMDAMLSSGRLKSRSTKGGRP
jgi:hypothetical protein